MQEALGVLIGIVMIGFFILFWTCMFTKQDIKFMHNDIHRIEKNINRLDADVRDIKYKK